jgi:uncharacterized SAM-binding protein YcdF (DUF218 family)
MRRTSAGGRHGHRAAALSLAGRLVALGTALLAATAILVGGFAAIYPKLATPPTAPAPAIIVLGAGVENDGTLDPQSLSRIETGVELYRAGLAPRLHLTGGNIDDGPPIAEAMRLFALAHGVPEAAISVETNSKSTLQNALFSAQMLDGIPAGAILVTSAYHLPRAWASFRRAGAVDPVLVPAHGPDTRPPRDRAASLARETLAWWFNLARVGLWHVATLAGVPESIRTDLLR